MYRQEWDKLFSDGKRQPQQTHIKLLTSSPAPPSGRVSTAFSAVLMIPVSIMTLPRQCGNLVSLYLTESTSRARAVASPCSSCSSPRPARRMRFAKRLWTEPQQVLRVMLIHPSPSLTPLTQELYSQEP